MLTDRNSSTPSASELIETLWNVNKNNPVKEYTKAQELIETLWNVNMILDYLQDLKLSN